MRIRHFLSSLLIAALIFSANHANAQTFLDFAALGSTNCILGKDVVLEDSNDPSGTNLATLLVGGNGSVHVKFGGTVGGVRAGGDLVLGKSSGSGATGLAVRGDVIGNGEIYIHPKSSIEGDVDAGEDVVVGQNSTVTGTVTSAADISVDPTSTVGASVPFGSPATVPNITLPTATTFTPGTSTVGDGSGNANFTLPPGDYGVLNMGVASTLALSSGTYTFQSIDMGQNSTLELNFTTSGAPVVIDEISILVTGDVDFGNSLDVNVNGEAGTSTAADVERKDYSGGLVLETHGSFHLQQNSQWVGLVIAPFGNIDFGIQSKIWGAGWSLDTHVKQGCVIDFQLADRFIGDGVRIPRIDFALYSEKKTTVGGDVIVSFTASVGSNGDVKVKSGGQTGSVRTGSKLFTGIAATINGNQVGNRRAYIRDGSIVNGNVDGGTDSGRVILGRDTTINGTVRSGNDILRGEGSVVNCSSAVCVEPNSDETASHTLLDLMDVLVDGTVATITGTDVATDHNIKRDEALTLAPGTYGRVKLGARSVLNLIHGEYYFESLITGSGGTINMDLTSGDELAIFALRDVKIGKNQVINLTGGDAPDVYVEVHNNFKIGTGSDWFGTVYAPYKNVIIGQDIPFVGAAYAGKNVIVKDGGSVDFELADRFYTIVGTP
jgi:hypothetical protein